MKKVLQNKFCGLMEQLALATDIITQLENTCLTDGKWDEKKIAYRAFPLIEENNKEQLIKAYKRLWEGFNSIKTDLDTLFPVVSVEQSTALYDEMEECFATVRNTQGYVNELLSKLHTSDRVADALKLNKTEYNGGLMVDSLNHYYRIFMFKLSHLCNSYGVVINLSPASVDVKQKTDRKSNDYTLDKDKLSSHLMASWKKYGNENLLFEDINRCLGYGNSKKIAAIANVIYLSGAIGSSRNRPPTFTKWLDIFEDICGGNFTKYPPNKLKKEIAEAKQLLYYLERPQNR